MGIPGKGKPRRSAHTNLLLQRATHVPSEYVPSEHLVRSLRARHLTPPALASPPTAHHALFFPNASAAVPEAVHRIEAHERVCTQTRTYMHAHWHLHARGCAEIDNSACAPYIVSSRRVAVLWARSTPAHTRPAENYSEGCVKRCVFYFGVPWAVYSCHDVMWAFLTCCARRRTDAQVIGDRIVFNIQFNQDLHV